MSDKLIDVRLDDGTVVRGVPEGITQTELTARVQRMRELKEAGVVHKAPTKFTPSGDKPDQSAALLSANPSVRFAKGAAMPILGTAQLVDNAFGGSTMNEILESNAKLQKEGMEAVGDAGFDWAGLAGNVLSPMSLATMKLPLAQTTKGKVGQNIAIGAGAGATTPIENGGENFWADKGAQTGIGAVAGALATPAGALVSKVGRMGYHGVIEPLTNPAAIKGRAYLTAAGDKVDEIIDLLLKNKQIVKGSAPTAGEAAVPAGRAEFSALQEGAAKVQPSEYLARSDSQNAARVEALGEWAGNPAKRAEAAATREAASKPLYQAGTVALPPNADKVPFQELLKHPSMKAATTRAEKLIEEKTGQKINIQGSGHQVTGSEAQQIKLAFDDLIKVYPKSAADTAELDAIKATRAAYIKWMEARFPVLSDARTTYKAASAPINQMDIGEELVNKLTPALRDDGAQRAGVFAGAVRDSTSTIKKATGEPRFEKLEDVLTGRQLQSVHNVTDDLARSDRHRDMARRGSQAAPDAISLASNNLEQQTGGAFPNLLHRGAMLANAIINRLEGRVNKKLAAEMAAEMLNPPQVGNAIVEAKAHAAKNKLLAEEIRRVSRAALGSGVSVSQGEF